MKTDRFSQAVLCAVLLFATALPAAGQIRIRIPGGTFSFESDSKKLSKALAQQVGTVKRNFDVNRKALRTVPGPGGAPAYSRPEVTGLIDNTEKDLDQAIVQIGEPDLDALRAWSAEEFQRIRDEAAALPRQSSFGLPGFFTPRAVAVLASLGARGASRAAPAPKPETVSAGAADGLLDQVGEVVSRIFVLAESDKLTVKLWVGSTPKTRADFTFRPGGKIKGSPSKQTTIRTNGKKDHVLRGLYDYDATLSQGAVTEIVRYPPTPGGAPVAHTKGERLDLVNGTGFFCCRFNESYCHHVDDEKECRP